MIVKLIPLLRLLNRVDQGLYMTVVLAVLRRTGLSVVGRPLWISSSVFLDHSGPGSISFGDRCVVSDSVKILTHDFSLDRIAEARGDLPADEELYRRAPVSIGARAFIGLGVIIMPGVSIGDDAIIGAGSVVTQSVPAKEVFAGNPARRVCTTDDLWDRRRDEFDVRKRRR
ncbi:acyltransferase [Rhodococcoides kyotonense]|uniref:Maltose O-acetyltransferase n=1 Tax=Rhodococcoides kyotonense TaxID=398843 RepID=A0A239MDN1_9NOCA|nr:acyltransferase [Rhodococcus kyotonensis]SNT40731.1 maltose O-acetyltransferase [Rhodococcus kyotonensis]